MYPKIMDLVSFSIEVNFTKLTSGCTFSCSSIYQRIKPTWLQFWGRPYIWFKLNFQFIKLAPSATLCADCIADFIWQSWLILWLTENLHTHCPLQWTCKCCKIQYLSLFISPHFHGKLLSNILVQFSVGNVPTCAEIKSHLTFLDFGFENMKILFLRSHIIKIKDVLFTLKIQIT